MQVQQLNKTKLLIIIDKLYVGGAENQVILNLKNLNHDEFSPYFACFDEKSTLLYKIPENIPKLILSRKYKFDIVLLFKLFKWIKENKIHIAHAHSLIDIFYLWIISFFIKLKLLYTVHGFWSTKYLSVLKLMCKIKKIQIIAVSTEVEKYLIQNRFNVKNITIVSNGIEFPENTLQLNPTNSTFKFGMISRFGSSKDHLCICMATNLLKTYNFEIHFWGKHDNVYGERIKNYILDNKLNNIYLHGESDNIPEKLLSLNGYIAASNTETFGLSMIEAMAHGLPVLASDIPVFNHISEFETAAILFKSNDASDLANKMVQLMSDNDICLKLSLKAKEAAKKYSIESTMAQLHGLYHKYSL